MQREKRKKRQKLKPLYQNIHELWDNERSDICIIGIPEEKGMKENI